MLKRGDIKEPCLSSSSSPVSQAVSQQASTVLFCLRGPYHHKDYSRTNNQLWNDCYYIAEV